MAHKLEQDTYVSRDGKTIYQGEESPKPDAVGFVEATVFVGKKGKIISDAQAKKLGLTGKKRVARTKAVKPQENKSA